MHQVVKIPQEIDKIERKVAQQHPAVAETEDAQQVAQFGVQQPYSVHHLSDFGLGPRAGGGYKSGGQALTDAIQRVESGPQVVEIKVGRGENHELRNARDLEKIFHHGAEVHPHRRPQPH